jgi:putative ABC transport system permease protein
MAPCDDKIAHMIGNAVSEIFKLAVDSFRASKLRFVLTALGMVIGMASIVLVVTIGVIGKQYVLDTLQKIGTN